MILYILAAIGALWLVLTVAFVVFCLVYRYEPRYMREARQAAGR